MLRQASMSLISNTFNIKNTGLNFVFKNITRDTLKTDINTSDDFRKEKYHHLCYLLFTKYHGMLR